MLEPEKNQLAKGISTLIFRHHFHSVLPGLIFKNIRTHLYQAIYESGWLFSSTVVVLYIEIG